MTFDELWEETEKKLWAAKTGPRDTSEHLRLTLKAAYELQEERIVALETALASVLVEPEPRKGDPA